MSTLNLKEKYERERREKMKQAQTGQQRRQKASATPGSNQAAGQASKRQAKPGSQEAKDRNSKANAIDEVYSNDGKQIDKNEFSSITRPKKQIIDDTTFKRGVLLLALVILAGLVWGLFLRAPAPQATNGNSSEGGDWYAVKLTNDEVYYGQILNTSADPVVIENVYYDYDQLNKDGDNGGQASKNLRLVKRGQETHGPSGAMQIVRDQVAYMEPLKEDSKVLRAILDYER